MFCFFLSYHTVSGQQAWPWLYLSASKIENRNHIRYFERLEIWYGEFGCQIVIKTRRAKQEAGGSCNSKLQKAAAPLYRSQSSGEPTALTRSAVQQPWELTVKLRPPKARACPPGDAGEAAIGNATASRRPPPSLSRRAWCCCRDRACQKHNGLHLFTPSSFCRCLQLSDLSSIQLVTQSEKGGLQASSPGGEKERKVDQGTEISYRISSRSWNWQMWWNVLGGKSLAEWEWITDAVVVQSISHVQLFETPWTAGHRLPHCSHLPEFAQIRVHWVGDAIQPSCPLPPTSPPALNLSQHQGLFQWVGS